MGKNEINDESELRKILNDASYSLILNLCVRV